MYNNQITNSANKIKATWNIVKAETNRLHRPSTNKYHNSPDTFNKYFLSIADKITCDIKYKNSKGGKTYTSPTHYLTKLSTNLFPVYNLITHQLKKLTKLLNL